MPIPTKTICRTILLRLLVLYDDEDESLSVLREEGEIEGEGEGSSEMDTADACLGSANDGEEAGESVEEEAESLLLEEEGLFGFFSWGGDMEEVLRSCWIWERICCGSGNLSSANLEKSKIPESVVTSNAFIRGGIWLPKTSISGYAVMIAWRSSANWLNMDHLVQYSIKIFIVWKKKTLNVIQQKKELTQE